MTTKIKKGFVPIARIIKSSPNKKFQQALIKSRARNRWEQVLCSFFTEAAGQTEVVDFRSGVLVVACLSKELAYKIRLLANRILEALNQVLKSRAVFALQLET